jgi:hypothetical protein
MHNSKHSVPLSIPLTTSINTATLIPFSDQVVGEVILDASLAASVTALTWYVSWKPGSTPVIAYDVGTNGVQTVAAGRAYQLPTQLIGAGLIAVTGNTTGTLHLNFKT